MTFPNPSTALASVVVDELVLSDVEVVVVSPGSRSAALAIAAVESSKLETVVVIDERSAAFRALGYTKAGRRAAVIATSGTATANFFPAVVEADMACVPIVVLTADRPAELHRIGANQTINQTDLYGTKVRKSIDISAPEADVDLNTRWRHACHAALSKGAGPIPGPVHINVAFREPTVPVTDDGRTLTTPYDFQTPRVTAVTDDIGIADTELPDVGGERGLIIAGDGEYDRDALFERAGELRWPVLATAMSSMRRAGVVTTYHHLVNDGVPAHLRPDTVIAVGAIGPSPGLEKLIESAKRRIRVDAWGRTIDPGRNADHLVHGDVMVLLVAAEVADAMWCTTWLEADATMRGQLVGELEDSPVTGGLVAHKLNGLDMGALVVASSLPIREVDAHFTRTGSVFANRGASGIDGFVSTALGIAGVEPRTVALTGDLSLLHDSNGFLTDVLPDLVIVVLDNNGGGLFDSLPQARFAPHYERLFVTPPNRDIEDLAVFHRLAFVELSEVDRLEEQVSRAQQEGGISIIRIPVDRETDLKVRQSLGR